VNWIRISVALGDDPKVHRLAEALGCRVAEAVGLVVLLLSRFPEHAPDGNLASVPASLVERWAGWDGERGAFETAFRPIFLAPDGLWPAWDKHNGTALKKMAADRDRLRQSRDGRNDVAATVATPPRDSRATVDATSQVRTDGRYEVQKQLRSRAETANGNGDQPIRPHAPAVAVAPPFCRECEGEAVETPKGRIVGMRHKAGCPMGNR
jgi:hypothetical protein